MLYYNERVARQFNVSREALLNRTDEELWPPEQAAPYRHHDREVLKTRQPSIYDEVSADPDGTARTWRSYKFPCNDAHGNILLGGISIDLTDELRQQAELKRYQAELEHANRLLEELACVDPLTQISNRRGFDSKLQQGFAQARTRNNPLCLLMIDVDRFKSHNDRFGHAHGDEVLRTLAMTLRGQLRSRDVLARYGGEEFVILLPDTHHKRAAKVAQRLVASVRDLPWPTAPVTISAGLSTLSPEIAHAEDLIACADRALYAAKCNGRDRFVSCLEVPQTTVCV